MTNLVVSIVLMLISANNLLCQNVEISTTPTDSRNNLRAHPLQPAPPAPAQPTPDLATLRAMNFTNATTLPTLVVTTAPVTTPVNVTTTNITTTNVTTITQPANITMLSNLTTLNITSSSVPVFPITSSFNNTNVTTPSNLTTPLNATALTQNRSAIINETNMTSLEVTANVTNITIVTAPVPASILNVTTINSTNATASQEPMTSNPATSAVGLFSLIPQGFFVDKSGLRPGQDFIILNTATKDMLSCNNIGNLTLNRGNFTQDALWVPSRVNQTDFLTFRSYWGGYLALKDDNRFDCLGRDVNANTYFTVEKGNLTSGTGNNTISIKASKGGYLGVLDNNIVSLNQINSSALFFPY